MANELQTLLIRIDANTQALANELKRATTAVSSAETTIGKSLGGIDKGFTKANSVITGFAKGLIVGLLPVLSGGAFIAAARDAIALGDAMEDTAGKVGLTVEELQELRFAAQQTGSSAAALDDSMAQFVKRVGEAARGTGPLANDVKRFGLALSDSRGNMRPVVDILKDYADVVKAAEDPTEQLRLTMVALGRSGDDQVNMLREGAAGIERYAQKSRDLGQVTTEQAAALGKANDAWDATFTAIERLRLRGFASLAPAIQDTADTLTRFVTSLEETADRIDRSWLGSLGRLIGQLVEFQKFRSSLIEKPLLEGVTLGSSIADEIKENEELLRGLRERAQEPNTGYLAGTIKETEDRLKDLYATAKELGIKLPSPTAGWNIELDKLKKTLKELKEQRDKFAEDLGGLEGFKTTAQVQQFQRLSGAIQDVQEAYKQLNAQQLDIRGRETVPGLGTQSQLGFRDTGQTTFGEDISFVGLPRLKTELSDVESEVEGINLTFGEYGKELANVKAATKAAEEAEKKLADARAKFAALPMEDVSVFGEGPGQRGESPLATFGRTLPGTADNEATEKALQNLDDRVGLVSSGFDDTQSSLERFRQNLAESIDMVELATSIAASTISSFSDSVARAAFEADSFGEALKNIALQSAQSATSGAISMAITSGLGMLLSGGGGGFTQPTLPGQKPGPGVTSGFVPAERGGHAKPGTLYLGGERGPELVRFFAAGGQTRAGERAVGGERGPEIVAPAGRPDLQRIVEQVGDKPPRMLTGDKPEVIGLNGPELFQTRQPAQVIPAERTREILRQETTRGERGAAVATSEARPSPDAPGLSERPDTSPIQAAAAAAPTVPMVTTGAPPAGAGIAAASGQPGEGVGIPGPPERSTAPVQSAAVALISEVGLSPTVSRPGAPSATPGPAGPDVPTAGRETTPDPVGIAGRSGTAPAGLREVQARIPPIIGIGERADASAVQTAAAPLGLELAFTNDRPKDIASVGIADRAGATPSGLREVQAPPPPTVGIGETANAVAIKDAATPIRSFQEGGTTRAQERAVGGEVGPEIVAPVGRMDLRRITDLVGDKAGISTAPGRPGAPVAAGVPPDRQQTTLPGVERPATISINAAAATGKRASIAPVERVPTTEGISAVSQDRQQATLPGVEKPSVAGVTAAATSGERGVVGPASAGPTPAIVPTATMQSGGNFGTGAVERAIGGDALVAAAGKTAPDAPAVTSAAMRDDGIGASQGIRTDAVQASARGPGAPALQTEDGVRGGGITAIPGAVGSAIQGMIARADATKVETSATAGTRSFTPIAGGVPGAVDRPQAPSQLVTGERPAPLVTGALPETVSGMIPPAQSGSEAAPLPPTLGMREAPSRPSLALVTGEPPGPLAVGMKPEAGAVMTAASPGQHFDKMRETLGGKADRIAVAGRGEAPARVLTGDRPELVGVGGPEVFSAQRPGMVMPHERTREILREVAGAPGRDLERIQQLGGTTEQRIEIRSGGKETSKTDRSFERIREIAAPPGRVMGGPVAGAQQYRGGERGAEMYVPTSNVFNMPKAPQNNGGGAVINIIDQRRGGDPPIEQSRSTMPDGRVMVTAIVRSGLGEMARNGELNQLMGGLYGIRPTPR